MSSDNIAIRVSNLSKIYEIYGQSQDRLKQSILPRMQKLVGLKPVRYYSEFWALKDISFDVEVGETVGIIGRNGSGKSTLLQMICGTLTPTAGTAETRGRVAALLELGSGFNPEFTGRENVYLNGSILGLSKQDVDARFNDIARFADIGDFIDQPVKIYSSGMHVRLAFAILAHVDADILVIDEALAVGDAVFVQKCMNFIREFQKKGTLLFVSHDINSVLSLCRTAVWLHQGEMREIGQAKTVAESYIRYTRQELYGDKIKLEIIDSSSSGREPSTQNMETNSKQNYLVEAQIVENLEIARGWKTGGAEITEVHMEHAGEGQPGIFRGGEKVRVVVRAHARQDLEQPIIGFMVRDRLGQDLFGENTLRVTELNPSPVAGGQDFSAEFVFHLPFLPNGQYAVMASVANGSLRNHIQHHWLNDVLIINVVNSNVRWGLVGIPFETVNFQLDIQN